MTAEIISVGTELLLGNILNTNAQYLSRELAALGITVRRQSTIGDNHGRLAEFVNEAKQRCDLLVFTGGLGFVAVNDLCQFCNLLWKIPCNIIFQSILVIHVVGF